MKILPIANFANFKKDFKSESKNVLPKNTSYQAQSYNYNPQIYYLNFKAGLKNNPLPDKLKKQLPEGISIEEIENNVICDKNILGKGANSTVYQIPYTDDYVLKLLKSYDPNNIKIADFPQEVNLGQPVWRDNNNPKILILKRIRGFENSIPNWSNTIYNPKINMPESISERQAQSYFSKVKKIADFPQESFDELAQKIVLLQEKGYKVDSVNPNNLMVNPLNNELNVIDYYKIPPKELKEKSYINSYLDIVALALDFTLLPEYFDKLTPYEQFELMDMTDEINTKAYSASEKAGLSIDKKEFGKYISYISQWFKAPDNGSYVRDYEKRANDFIKMVRNPWKWAMDRYQTTENV